MKKIKIITLCLFTLCLLFLSSNEIKAQHEIPDNIKDHISQGLIAFDSVNIVKAIIEFNKAIEIAPDFPDTYYYLGETYTMLQGTSFRAARNLRKYLALYPDAPDKIKVTNEIALLDEAVKTKHNSSLRGIELISLKDGIYIKGINQLAYTTTDNAFDARAAVIAGDKLVKINKTDIKGLPLQTVINIIDKEPENRIGVKVIRGGIETFAVLIKTENNKLENIFDLGEEDLWEILGNESKPVVIIFWNTWSKECRDYIPILRTATQDGKDGLKIITVNVEENNFTALACGVSKVPTVFFVKNGKQIGRISGYQPEILKEKISLIDKITDPFDL